MALLMKFLYLFLILLLIILEVSSVSEFQKNKKLIEAIAGFCTSFDGYDSGFCVDYAKLRKERAVSSFPALTTPEDIAVKKTAPAEKPPILKGEPGGILTTERNKPAVLAKNDKELAELKKESIPTVIVVSKPEEKIVTKETSAVAKPPPSIAEPGEVVFKNANKTTVVDPNDQEFGAPLKKPSHPNATVTSPEEIVMKTASAEKPPPLTVKPGEIVFHEGNKTTVVDPNDTVEPDDELAGLTPKQIQDELRKIIQEELAKKTIQKTSPDDPACSNLRDEYDEVCFATPPLAAFQETREFCLAFVKNCQNSLLTNIFTNVKSFKVDFTAYCKKHRERFRYVCPDPLRFQSFAENAVDFCVRYQDRCPKELMPAEPVQFHRKDEGHIYTREIEFWCTRSKRTAYNYCTEPDLLKVYKYQMFCGMYKYACIDVYKRVIYG